MSLYKYVLLLSSFLTLNVQAFTDSDIAKLKQTCSCVGCDFSHADLSNFKLADKQTLDPQKAQRDQNGFIICDISHANFDGANLQGAYFSVADFAPGIADKVGKIIMKNTSFRRANLADAHFNAVIADQANFSFANLKNASFMKASSMQKANFKNANLQDVKVSPPMGGCGADFTASNFSRANLQNSKINANFTDVNFSYANLQQAELTPCDNDPSSAFKNSNFKFANLTNAKFNNQFYDESLLKNAILCHTKLSEKKESNRDCH